MKRLLTNRQLQDINSSVEDIHRTRYEVRKFYILNESLEYDEDNPLDPVFGEPHDPWEEESVTVEATLQPFLAEVIRDSRDVSYDRSGFDSQRSFVLSLSAKTYYEQGITWTLGMKVMADGKTYRVSDIDERGFVHQNRFILTIDEVT